MNSSIFDGLDESLTTILRSAIGDNFPDFYKTYLRGIVKSSPAPNGADFITGDDVDFSQFFFNDDPDLNFPNTFAPLTNVVTSGSDINFASPADDEEVKIGWGRHGSDRLSGFNPSADLDGKRRIDLFIGDLLEEELFQTSPGPYRTWQDTFILGDWQTPYYVENGSDSLGLNQFALIIDFNPSEDIIQLHGTSQDYQLVETSLGTAIFWRQGNSFDLIGVVGGIPAQNISLDGNYFDFKGNTPPETVLEKAEQIGTAGVDYLFSSSVDVEGNLYVGGGTDGSLAGQNLGARDAWLSKYDSNGNQLWSKQFGTNRAELVFDIATHSSNVYVTGNTTGGLGDNTNQGGVDVYLAKYDSDGNQEWIQQFGSLTFEDYTSVTTDTSGNIYLSGHTVGSLGGDAKNFGQVLGQGVDGGAPSTDPYVFKFDSDGNELWRTQLGTVTLDDSWGLAIDQDGNVFLGGNTKGDFGGENASSAGEYDAWLVKLNQDGQEEWVKQFGIPDYDFLWDIETDSMGNLYATGWTLGDLAGESAGSYDVWLAKYDTDGNQVWIKQFGTTGDDAPFTDGIEIDSNDNIFLTGYTDGDLGGVNAGSYDAWVAKYDTDGNQLWIQQFGTPEYDTASTVSADDDGNLYVSGITDGSLGDSNAGSYDSWVVKLDANTGQVQDFTGTNDQLNGSNANDFIEGNAGDDTIYGNGGEDTLIGGDGDN
nr:SBBP repeat-containing protein [Calothrix sp. MO_167.B12]